MSNTAEQSQMPNNTLAFLSMCFLVALFHIIDRERGSRLREGSVATLASVLLVVVVILISCYIVNSKKITRVLTIYIL